MSISFDTNEKVCNNRSGIYVIVNIKTEKFYIGSAVKLNNRKYHHLSDLRKGKHGNRHLQRSYNKYGEDCFIFKILEYVEDKNLLEDIEDNWIKKYKPLGVTYNIREEAKSNFGIKRSDETRKKMSLAKQNMSDETRKKMSEAAKGRIILDETRKKKSQNISNKTRQKMSEARKGKKLSEETRKKISEAQRGKSRKSCFKPVLQFTKNNEFMKRYNSITEAKKEIGINNGRISECCRGKRKYAGGFIWKYLEN